MIVEGICLALAICTLLIFGLRISRRAVNPGSDLWEIDSETAVSYRLRVCLDTIERETLRFDASIENDGPQTLTKVILKVGKFEGGTIDEFMRRFALELVQFAKRQHNRLEIILPRTEVIVSHWVEPDIKSIQNKGYWLAVSGIAFQLNKTGEYVAIVKFHIVTCNDVSVSLVDGHSGMRFSGEDLVSNHPPGFQVKATGTEQGGRKRS